MATKKPFPHYLRLKGVTYQFDDGAKHYDPPGTVRVTYQETMDPNEELNYDVRTAEEARKEYKDLKAKGAKVVDGYHACKRCEHWYDDGHDD